jgi:hypothetical protein
MSSSWVTALRQWRPIVLVTAIASGLDGARPSDIAGTHARTAARCAQHGRFVHRAGPVPRMVDQTRGTNRVDSARELMPSLANELWMWVFTGWGEGAVARFPVYRTSTAVRVILSVCSSLGRQRRETIVGIRVSRPS